MLAASAAPVRSGSHTSHVPTRVEAMPPRHADRKQGVLQQSRVPLQLCGRRFDRGIMRFLAAPEVGTSAAASPDPPDPPPAAAAPITELSSHSAAATGRDDSSPPQPSSAPRPAGPRPSPTCRLDNSDPPPPNTRNRPPKTRSDTLRSTLSREDTIRTGGELQAGHPAVAPLSARQR